MLLYSPQYLNKFRLMKGNSGGLHIPFFFCFFFSSINFVPIIWIGNLRYQLFPILCLNLYICLGSLFGFCCFTVSWDLAFSLIHALASLWNIQALCVSYTLEDTSPTSLGSSTLQERVPDTFLCFLLWHTCLRSFIFSFAEFFPC